MGGSRNLGAGLVKGRRGWRWLGLMSLLVVASGAAGCVTPPPTVPAPALPTGIGVQWFRDNGGTVDPFEGTYAASTDVYTLLNGATVGPQPVDPLSHTLPPTLVERVGSMNGLATAPESTARLPWNGFAGEGITLVATGPFEGEWSLEFPSGSCSLGTVGQSYQIQMVSPSPDGTKVALRSSDGDGGSTVTVMALTNGPTCPQIANAHYHAQASSPTRAGNVLVWSPDSTAIAFAVFHNATPGNPQLAGTGIERLNASTSATPVAVVARTTGDLAPMGWSVDNRLLFARITIEGDSPVSRLVTQAVAGGPERLINKTTLPTGSAGFLSPLTLGGNYQYLHYGYFVPGTTTIVYQRGSSGVTDSDGYTFPRYYVALEADADNAESKPILGSAPPLTWHQEAFAERFDPPFELIDVPNAEFIDRFTH